MLGFPSQRDVTAADGQHGGVGAVIGVEFAQDSRNVVLDRLLRDFQGDSDLLVGVAVGDVDQNLALAGGEGGDDVQAGVQLAQFLEILQYPLGDDRAGQQFVDGVFAAGGAVNGLQEFAGGAAFLEAGHGGGADDVEEFGVIGVRRQNDDADVGVIAHDLAAQLQAVGGGQVRAQEDDVGEGGFNLGEGVFVGIAFDHFQVFPAGQGLGDAGTEKGLLIANHNPGHVLCHLLAVFGHVIGAVVILVHRQELVDVLTPEAPITARSQLVSLEGALVAPAADGVDVDVKYRRHFARGEHRSYGRPTFLRHVDLPFST